MQDDTGSIPKTNGIVQYFSVISEASHWSDKAGLNHQSNMANMGISSTLTYFDHCAFVEVGSGDNMCIYIIWGYHHI